ncbi:hypothetical protein PIB30_054602 [Stylosanthes scabra]|uniref:Uncharacterized protein n=1 Tax=Stylosanthes scabra TaxID=79078 RepID=A0ABU6QJP0_9FABA|nr:hypothetical protein [Stylosanthes scabra]
MLRIKFSEHTNLVRYAQRHKTELIEAGTSPSYDPSFNSDASSSASRARSTSSSKAKSKQKSKREETKEEKTLKKRAKYFVAAQLAAVFLFVSIMSGYGGGDGEIDDDGYDLDD